MLMHTIDIAKSLSNSSRLRGKGWKPMDIMEVLLAYGELIDKFAECGFGKCTGMAVGNVANLLFKPQKPIPKTRRKRFPTPGRYVTYFKPSDELQRKLIDAYRYLDNPS